MLINEHNERIIFVKINRHLAPPHPKYSVGCDVPFRYITHIVPVMRGHSLLISSKKWHCLVTEKLGNRYVPPCIHGLSCCNSPYNTPTSTFRSSLLKLSLYTFDYRHCQLQFFIFRLSSHMAWRHHFLQYLIFNTKTKDKNKSTYSAIESQFSSCRATVAL